MYFRARTIQIACALLLLALGWSANLYRSFELGLDKEIPWWVTAGVPGAVAAKFYDRGETHTIYGQFETVFWGSVLGKSSAPRKLTSDVDDATRLIITQKPGDIDFSDIRPIPGLKGDDKGIVEFIRLSYDLFGTSSSNFILTYYVILALSIVLFAVTFYPDLAYLYCLGAFLAILWLIQPMIAHNDQLTSLLALRAFPLLSIPACLHCILAALDTSRRQQVNWIAWVTTFGQLLIVLFCLHVRSSAVWQPLAILLACVPLILINWRRHATAATVFCGVLALGTIGGQLAVNAYHYFGYSDVYRKPENISTRLFWHNIYSGLAFNHNFAKRFDITVDDISIMRNAGLYLVEHGRSTEWEAIGGTTEGYSGLQYRAYDGVVREMLFSQCARYLGDCLSATFIDRPLATGHFLAWLYGIRGMAEEIDLAISSSFGDVAKRQMMALDETLRTNRQFAYLWHPLIVIYLLAFAILAARQPNAEWRTAIAGAAALTVGSLATVLLGYPLPWTIQDTAVCGAILIYAGLGFTLVSLARLASPFGGPHRA